MLALTWLAMRADALRLLQDLLVARARRYSTLDSWHRGSLRVRQHRAHRALVGRMDFGGAAQLADALLRLLGEDVALERLRALDASARAHLEALGSAFLRLHLGHDCSCFSLTPGGPGFGLLMHRLSLVCGPKARFTLTAYCE